MFKQSLIITAILFAANIAQAANISITATVDKTEASLEDEIELQIEVKGLKSGATPTLNIPNTFYVDSRGTTSSFQIINGQMNSSLIYSYTLSPQKAGVFIVGPFSISVDGQAYSSDKIKLLISGQTEEKKSNSTEIVYITHEVDKSTAYANEQITYSIKFYRRVEIDNAAFNYIPKFPEFIVEDIEKDKRYSKSINGQLYQVYEIKKALFPVKTGIITIESPILSCDVLSKPTSRRKMRGSLFDDFFDSGFGFKRERKNLRTNPLTLQILSVPDEGKPLIFTNLVGTFDIATSISANSVEKNNSVTLSIDIFGSGNISNIQTPLLPELSDFKLYDDKPDTNYKIIDNKIVGKKTFRKALVPLSEGNFTIPPVEIAYFNPATKQYEIKKSDPIKLTVLPSSDISGGKIVSGQFGLLPNQQDVKILGQDILPLHTSLSALSAQTIVYPSLYSLLILFPIAGFIFSLSIRKKRDLLIKDSSYMTRKNALKTAKKELALLNKSSNVHKDSSCIIRNFMGNKLNLTGAALTPAEIKEKLEKYNIDPNLVGELVTILDNCDNLQYSCGNDTSRQVLDTNKIKKLLLKLDKQL